VRRPALLFYCQHSLGLGHAVRSFALAAALVRHFRVVVACGGELPESLSPPDDVELVVLPALASRDGQLVSRGRSSLDAARQRRRRLLLDTFRTLSPRVLVIELFPFGRRKFADELVPLLEAAVATAPSPVVVSSVRDILVGRQPDQQAHDTLTCVLANRYFDAVLVHSDPSFARLEESFRPSIPLQVPVFHTGFVVPDKRGRGAGPKRDGRVVVSAGGGLVGEPLLRAALDARPLLPENLRLDLVAGPFLPDEAWSSLEASARALEGVRLRRFVADLAGELATASASLSQCGYNTALDLLRARVPALVVPFSEGREDEQTRRARRLERLGAVRVLEPERLDASSIAQEVQELLRFRPRPLDLDVDGARASGRLLARLAGAGFPLEEKATAV
jgi:predicted glycosyltransferase